MFSCSNDFNVQHFGELKKIMKQNDLSAHINFLDYKNNNHIYSLGALKNLEGEFIVLDGEPYIIEVENENVVIKSDFDFKASLAVLVEVKKWKEIPIPQNIRTKSDFENFLYKQAKIEGISIEKPFPFLVEGLISSISWHVVNWNIEDEEHSHEKHVKSGPNGTNINESVTLLGFYSDQHHGVFTHHSTNIHLHFIRNDKKLGGHVDDFVLGVSMILKLPT